MKVRDVVATLEGIAPPSLAAEWDNVGLLAGDGEADVGKLMLCIDLTVPVLAEAVRARAQMVMAYHPVIFKPISRVTAAATPVLLDALRRGIAVHCTHTALDAAAGGANDVLAEAMGLDDYRPLEPVRRDGECKIVVFVPQEELSRVAEAAFAAGAGRIGNYRDCAFFSHGIGTFCGGEGSQPTIGAAGEHEAVEEMRLEVVAPLTAAADVCREIRRAHSYETPAMDVYPLADVPPGVGMGRIGRFARSVKASTVVDRLKKAAGVKRVLVARPPGGEDRPVATAACGAGSCGDMWRRAAAMGAELFVTGEMRHHDALAAAAAGVTVVCLGHSNSERMTLERLAGRIAEARPKLKVVISDVDRDPFEIE